MFKLFLRGLSAFILTATALAATATPATRTLKIAVLLPEADSSFVQAGAAIAEGVRAAALSSPEPVKVIYLPAKRGQSAISHLQDAALSGAHVAIGPIVRDAVQAASEAPFLPLPTVALNIGDRPSVTPALMMNFSLTLEAEARQIAEVAVSALPLTTQSGRQPSMRIFAGQSLSDQRIANAYEEVLKAHNVLYERVELTPEMLDTTKLLYTEAPVPDSEKPKLLPVPDQYENPSGYLKATNKNRAIMSEFKARLAYREPPYHGALLAMDNRMAALVKPRLPRLTKTWGTSLVNPNSGSSGQVASLTYDLKDLIFVEAPLVTITNENTFLLRFGVEMPKSVLDKRLFAFGVDAFTLACRWARFEPDIVFLGTTGQVEFHRSESPTVQRQGRLVEVESKGLVITTEEAARKPIAVPNFEVIQKPKAETKPAPEAGTSLNLLQ